MFVSLSFFRLEFFFIHWWWWWLFHSILRWSFVLPSNQILPYRERKKKKKKKKSFDNCTLFLSKYNVYYNKYVLLGWIFGQNWRVDVYCICIEKVCDNQSFRSVYVKRFEILFFVIIWQYRNILQLTIIDISLCYFLSEKLFSMNIFFCKWFWLFFVLIIFFRPSINC